VVKVWFVRAIGQIGAVNPINRWRSYTLASDGSKAGSVVEEMLYSFCSFRVTVPADIDRDENENVSPSVNGTRGSASCSETPNFVNRG
jgi:hypothetical protein